MRAITKSMMVGAALSSLSCADPAAAQYSAYANPGAASGDYSGPSSNRQIAVNRCSEEVQRRLGGYGQAYGNGSGRVLGISSIGPLGYGGGLTISGVASSGRYLASVYSERTPVDLSWHCTADNRGQVMNVSIQPAQGAYRGSNSGIPAPYEGDDYSKYGYYRY